jgi:GntR family transcriptional regulator
MTSIEGRCVQAIPDWQPRYAQLAAVLAEEIGAGRHKLGALLPSENELAEAHSVSRATVREALRRLESLEMIERIQGIGTRVVSTSAGAKYMLAARSMTEMMGYGAPTRLVLHERRTVVANAGLAARYDLPRGTRWLHLRGVRFLVGKSPMPFAVNEFYVAERFQHLAHDVETDATPVYRRIEREPGMRVATIEQDVTATTLTAQQARDLQATRGATALQVVRRFRGQDGAVVEATRNIHPSDRFTFSLRLTPA